MKPIKNIPFVDITSEISNNYFNSANKYTDSKEGCKMLKISHICELYSSGCIDINDLITKLTNLTKASQTEIYELLQKYTDFEDYKSILLKQVTAERIKTSHGIKTIIYKDGEILGIFPPEQKQPHKNSYTIILNCWTYTIKFIN